MKNEGTGKAGRVSAEAGGKRCGNCFFKGADWQAAGSGKRGCLQP